MLDIRAILEDPIVNDGTDIMGETVSTPLLDKARALSNNDKPVETMIGQAHILYQELNTILEQSNGDSRSVETELPQEWRKQFDEYVSKIGLSLISDEDDFYGYFFFQMNRILDFGLDCPAGVAFKGERYVLHIHPEKFLLLMPEQMENVIKHEVLHIVSLHLWRAKTLEQWYSKAAINMAMDVVVNTYLRPLWVGAIDLAWVNRTFKLTMKPYESMEFYARTIQDAIDRLHHNDTDAAIVKAGMELSGEEELLEGVLSSLDSLHDIWNTSDNVGEEVVRKFTEKMIENSRKGSVSSYLDGILQAVSQTKAVVPWHVYLRNIIGSAWAGKKKTTMRLNRRQPDRLDLRGQMRKYKANVTVALDISGSISDTEFIRAMEQIVQMVIQYDHTITIVECDDALRRIYSIRNEKDIKERLPGRGGTAFSPVFAYCNSHPTDVLVYFTDGEGEARLKVRPRGYKILWILTGRKENLSVDVPYGVVKRLDAIEEVTDTIDYEDLRMSGFSMANQQGPLAQQDV